MRFLQWFGFRDIIYDSLWNRSQSLQRCVCVWGVLTPCWRPWCCSTHNGVQCTQVRSSQSVQLVSTESVSIHTQILIDQQLDLRETHISTLKYCTHTHTHTLKYGSHTHTHTHTHTEVLFTHTHTHSHWSTVHSLTHTHTHTQYHLCVPVSVALVHQRRERVDLRHIPLSGHHRVWPRGRRSLKPAAPHQTVRPDTPEEQDTHVSMATLWLTAGPAVFRCVYFTCMSLSRDDPLVAPVVNSIGHRLQVVLQRWTLKTGIKLRPVVCKRKHVTVHLSLQDLSHSACCFYRNTQIQLQICHACSFNEKKNYIY